MKSHSLAFLLILISASTFAQKAPKLYQDLVRNHEQQDFEACIKLENDVDLMARSQRDTVVANSFFYVGDAHLQLGDLDKAITWFERERGLRADLGLTQTEAFSSSLYNLAYVYMKAGNNPKATTMASQLIDNDRKIYGAASPEFVSSVLSTVDIYIQVDRFNDAEKLLQSTIKQQPKNSAEQGVLLNKLGDLYTLTSQYSKASRTLQSAINILERTPGEKSPEFISASINLGILSMAQGKYAEAEEAFDFALSKLDHEEYSYNATLNNQALVYQSLGQLERSERTFRAVQAMDSTAYGVTSPDFAITLTNLGLVYSDEGLYTKAIETLTRALDIQKKNNEQKTVSYARKLNNLARVYRMSGDPAKAIPLHEEAQEIFKAKLGENSAEVATTSYNLGLAHWRNGQRPLAIQNLKKSASIRASKLGKKHPKYAESMQKIAEFQWEQKQLKEAHQSFNEVFENYYAQINSFFPVLTEDEKSKLFYNTIKPSFEKFNSFMIDLRTSEPTVTGEAFDHQVNTKASIMYATEKVKEAIYVSKDTALIRQFDLWQAEKEMIAKLYSQNAANSTIDSLQQSADLLEKELTRKSSVFARQFIRKKITWQEIQKALKPNEAAIEIIRFNAYTPENAGSFKNEILYALLIVSRETKLQPDLVLLRNGNEMENKFLNYYRNNIKFLLEDPRSYTNFAKPLADYLKQHKIKKAYLSPDGVYNQININTLRNPETQKFLVDEFEIRMITNSREIVEQKTIKSNSQSSVLIGFPKFNLDESALPEAATATRSITRGGNLNRGMRGGLLRYMRGEGGITVLPATQVEINQISKLSPNPEIFMEDMASEGLLKQVISPMILHVATHGYFLEEDETMQAPQEGKSSYVPSPLLKAGIILAGAENFLKTGVPVNDSGDDGILTAYEAMNLKLEDTELVVLSACETGLGVVKNGEGVYGLQRAFKMAGARSLIMSLWSVDDAATQELMSLFYSEKQKTPDQYKAFRNAQQKLKEKYPHPFYWGAFIIVGI